MDIFSNSNSARISGHSVIKFAHLAFLIILLYFFINSSAQATSSLSFNGEGYSLGLEIGTTDRPVIASIDFLAPGIRPSVVLRTGLLVKTFDVKRRELLLVYNGSDPRVPPFILSVHTDKAILEIDGKRLQSKFSWEM
jgi:hypothetical protein